MECPLWLQTQDSVELWSAYCDLWMQWELFRTVYYNMIFHIDGLVQERRNSSALALEFSALALELRLSCTNLDGLMQERRNSIANALELGLSCTNPAI